MSAVDITIGIMIGAFVILFAWYVCMEFFGNSEDNMTGPYSVAPTPLPPPTQQKAAPVVPIATDNKLL